MEIRRLDHFTLRTALLAQTTAFYVQVAGLSVGWRPPFPFDGRWLYHGDHPVLHLIGSGASTPPLPGTDHIAFRCDDLPSFEA